LSWGLLHEKITTYDICSLRNVVAIKCVASQYYFEYQQLTTTPKTFNANQAPTSTVTSSVMPPTLPTLHSFQIALLLLVFGGQALLQKSVVPRVI
jgi:hypothetical protein